jgi:phospholipid transport system substrate-binding protein
VSVPAGRRVVCSGLLVVAGWAVAPFGALADVADDAAKLIQTVADEVIELIKHKTGAERQAGIQKVLETYFDMPYMGRAALGTHWGEADDEQRERYLKAAVGSEARAYSERFGQYGGQTLDLGKVITKPGNVFVVQSKLNQTNGQPIKIEWEVRDTGGGSLRISDVKIEGVSMVMTRRSDFNSYIQGHGGKVQALIQELEAKARQ